MCRIVDVYGNVLGLINLLMLLNIYIMKVLDEFFLFYFY